MALKKYTREVNVILMDGTTTVSFVGADGFAAYNALLKHEQIVAKGTISGTAGDIIIPYHAVLAATVVNGAEDATLAEDATCPAESDESDESNPDEGNDPPTT